jgi:hypothetical protein
MTSNNYEMDKCLQVSLKKYIDNDKININDNIVILYHHPFDRRITHCYINNNGDHVYSSEFGEIKNMGHVVFEPLQDKLMLKSLCRQTNIHFLFDKIYSYLDVKKVFYRYIDDEITYYGDNDIVFYATLYYMKTSMSRGWKIIERWS